MVGGWRRWAAGPLPGGPEHGTVLAGVKARPCGRPAAGLDTGCGRRRSAAIGRLGREGWIDPGRRFGGLAVARGKDLSGWVGQVGTSGGLVLMVAVQQSGE
jgi:hypothetical protein